MRVFSNAYFIEGNLQITPDQAAGLPDISSDGKTITVKLKSGLVWSDGKPLTARDWVFGTKRQLNPSVGSASASTLYAVEGAEKYNTADPKKVSPDQLKQLRDAVGVSAPDDATIVYKLIESSPWFPVVLTTGNGLPIREDLVTAGGASEVGQEWAKPGIVIGNGPYVLTRHDPGGGYALEANPRCARGEPPIKTIEIRGISDDDAALYAFRVGGLDMVPHGVQVQNAIARDPMLEKQASTAMLPSTVYIGFNTRVSPFDNRSVRRAFAAAFDRAQLRDKAFDGLALVADQLVPPGLPGHYEDNPLQKFDRDGARNLLATAGFPGGKGMSAITLTYSNTPPFDAIARWAHTIYKDTLGVEITPNPVSWETYQQLIKSPKSTPQMYVTEWLMDYPDPRNWYSEVFRSDRTRAEHGWKNDEFDQLARAADGELTASKRDSLYRKAADILNTEAPSVFLYHPVIGLLIGSRVHGFVASPFSYWGEQSLYSMTVSPTAIPTAVHPSGAAVPPAALKMQALGFSGEGFWVDRPQADGSVITDFNILFINYGTSDGMNPRISLFGLPATLGVPKVLIYTEWPVDPKSGDNKIEVLANERNGDRLNLQLQGKMPGGLQNPQNVLSLSIAFPSHPPQPMQTATTWWISDAKGIERPVQSTPLIDKTRPYVQLAEGFFGAGDWVDRLQSDGSVTTDFNILFLNHGTSDGMNPRISLYDLPATLGVPVVTVIAAPLVDIKKGDKKIEVSANERNGDRLNLQLQGKMPGGLQNPQNVLSLSIAFPSHPPQPLQTAATWWISDAKGIERPVQFLPLMDQTGSM